MEENHPIWYKQKRQEVIYHFIIGYLVPLPPYMEDSHIIASLCDLMHQLSFSSIPAFPT